MTHQKELNPSETAPAYKAGRIKKLIRWSGTILALVIAILSLEKPRIPITVEVRARQTQTGKWQLTYEDTGALLRSKKEKNREVTVPGSPDFQTLSFRLRYKTQLKTFKLSSSKLSGPVEIHYIRLKSWISHHTWQADQIASTFKARNSQLKQIGKMVTLKPENTAEPVVLAMEKDISPVYSALQNNWQEKILCRWPAVVIALFVYLCLGHLSSLDFQTTWKRMKPTFRQIKWNQAYFKYLLSALFIIAISLPLCFPGKWGCLRFNYKEKRALAPKPVLNPSELWSFPADFENYFNDHFGFRNLFIDFNNLLDIHFYKISPIPKVIIGKEGWLFYRSELAENGNTIGDYQGKYLFTPQQLHQLRENLKAKAEWCRHRNIYFLVVLAPNKETLYDEYMPNWIKKGPQTRLDQIDEMIKADPQLPVLNLTPALKAQKKTKQLYYKGGTHWNQYGAYYGYRAIMQHLSLTFPQLKPFPLEAYQQSVNPHSKKDHWFGFNENRYITLTLKPAEAHKIKQFRRLNLLMFRDSFIEASPHFYQPHFKTFVRRSNRRFNLEKIEQQKPDIVIWEIIERASGVLIGESK